MRAAIIGRGTPRFVLSSGFVTAGGKCWIGDIGRRRIYRVMYRMHAGRIKVAASQEVCHSKALRSNPPYCDRTEI